MANDKFVVPSSLPFRWGDLKSLSMETGIEYSRVRLWKSKSHHIPSEENNRLLEAALRLLDNRKKIYEQAAAISKEYEVLT